VRVTIQRANVLQVVGGPYSERWSVRESGLTWDSEISPGPTNLGPQVTDAARAIFEVMLPCGLAIAVG
jgi:hypothetical protein